MLVSDMLSEEVEAVVTIRCSGSFIRSQSDLSVHSVRSSRIPGVGHHPVSVFKALCKAQFEFCGHLKPPARPSRRPFVLVVEV